ncbi:MAG: hypothetical protein V2J24_11620 [Pseudomonadales bacterium]|jgi:hypothetical protein|nr:hypothetical protein [Pseudomonadales bacterium]
MKELARFLVVLLAPFVLIFGGAGVIALGVEREIEFLIWTGLIVLGSGLLWCLFLYLWADSGSFRD